MGFVPGIVAAANIEPVRVEWVSERSSASDVSSYNFTGMDFGTPAPDRKIAVYVTKRNTGNLTPGSVTIAGITATQITLPSGSTQQGDITGAWYVADVPTGSSGTIQVSFPFGSGFSFTCYCYAIYGAGDTPVSYVNRSSSNTTNFIEQTGIVYPYGAGLTVAYSTSGTRSAVTWLGVVQDYTVQADNDIRSAIASGVNLGEDIASHEVRATFTTLSDRVLHSVVWLPR